MTAAIIDGKAFAAGLRARIAEYAATFEQSAGRKAGLAVVLVGADAASQVYVASKGKATVECGMNSFEHKLPADADEASLLALIEQLNADPAVDGILVQLPLPGHLDEQKVIATINTDKDVDGFHVTNAGRLSLLRLIGPGYYLLLHLSPGALVGRGRYELRRAAHELAGEFV